MSGMLLLNKPKIMLLAMGRYLRRMVTASMTSLTGISALVPERLLIAPQDLRTADPTRAQEFYTGSYALGGKVVETAGKNPFLIAEPGTVWERHLQEFGWIRHISAANDTLSSSHARSIIRDWIDINGGTAKEVAWDVEIASRRLIAWHCHSIAILSGADHEFHQQFMRSLGAHVRFLKRFAATADAGIPRLFAFTALAYASICHAGQYKKLKTFHNALNKELAAQVFADGGHVSRNPAVLIDILAMLLPLREACASVGVEPPSEVVASIERLLPALRFFRMGDGSLAHFNNAGLVEQDLMVTLLRYDGSLGTPLNEASQSGYQRLQSGNAVALMDTGQPPPGELSATAHAGCLAFEFSSHEEALIINCGTPPPELATRNEVWRSTAAHSTAVLNETSSCRFESSGNIGKYLGGQVISGDLKVQSSRNDNSTVKSVAASHKGYLREYGIVHARSLTLDKNGDRIQGKDCFTGNGRNEIKSGSRAEVAIRFHLHPDIKAAKDKKTGCILLQTRQKQIWQFQPGNVPATLEESIFFSSMPLPKKTVQIVLRLNAVEKQEVNWALQRIETAN